MVTGAGRRWGIALWQYQIEANESGGTKLIEYYELRTLSPLMKENGQPEIDQRRNNMIESIRATLEAMKATAEGL